MKNTIASGEVFDYTVPPSTTIASGDVVIMEKVAGVAVTSGTEGDVIAVCTEGVFSVAKLTSGGNTFAQGAPVYHDGTTATTDPADTFIGFAYEAAIQADTTVSVMLEASAQSGGTSGVTPETSPTLTVTGAVADNTKASIDTELGKVKADLEAIVAALEAAGVFI